MYPNDLMSDINSSDNFSCLNFTTESAELVLHIKASLGVITVIANLLAIFLIVLSKKFKEFTFRLVIYLLITDILQAVAMCLALSPIVVPDAEDAAEVRPDIGWNDFCAATGFVLMTTMWMGNIVIIWIVVHLLVRGWRLYHTQVTVEKNRNVAAPINNKNKMKYELYGVIFLIIGPFIIGIIPFFLPHQMYGISGLWCWIRMLYAYCGDITKETLIVVFVFFYGPLILIVLFSTISMMGTIVFVCYGAVRRGGRIIVNQHQRQMKEIMLVLAYPMLYCTVCLLLLANRVYSLTHTERTPFMPLWMTHTVADPVRVLLPAIAFLLHPYVWRDLCTRKKSPTSEMQTTQDKPDQCNIVTGEESMEENLLAAQDSGNINYGGCDDDRYLSLVVESK